MSTVTIDIPYSLVIETTKEPDFFGFFSPDLEGFTGVGHSVEDCLLILSQVGDEEARRAAPRPRPPGSQAGYQSEDRDPGGPKAVRTGRSLPGIDRRRSHSGVL